MPGIEEWIVNKATEAAKAAAKAGFDWLAPKAYEQAKPLCGEVGSGASVFEQLFCMALGQLAPAVDPMAQLQAVSTRSQVGWGRSIRTSISLTITSAHFVRTWPYST